MINTRLVPDAQEMITLGDAVARMILNGLGFANRPLSLTPRWVFQLLEGIHRVRVTVQGQVHDLIEGLNDVQIKILRLFG